MITEHKGQHIILIVMLILALTLSYCAVPTKTAKTSHQDKSQSRWILRPWLANLIGAGSGQQSAAGTEMAAQGTGDEHIEAVEPDHSMAAPEPETLAKAPEPEPETATQADATAVSETVHEADTEKRDEPLEEGVILMNSPQYAKHTKPIARFTHQKHIDEYSISCGDCHHDEAGKPLDLKPGDPVQSCIACHKETKMKKGEKLSKPEKIMKYHKEALHANCIGCHKAYNIENGDPKGKKPAPASCKACHKES